MSAHTFNGTCGGVVLVRKVDREWLSIGAACFIIRELDDRLMQGSGIDCGDHSPFFRIEFYETVDGVDANELDEGHEPKVKTAELSLLKQLSNGRVGRQRSEPPEPCQQLIVTICESPQYDSLQYGAGRCFGGIAQSIGCDMVLSRDSANSLGKLLLRLNRNGAEP
jgi:hypothetical protein